MKRTIYQRSVLLAFLVLLPGLLAAQVITLDPVFNPDQFRIHQIGPEKGMSSPFMTSAFQDKYGYIWVGTQYGLDIYDGYSFRNIRLRESDSINSQILIVVNFLEDPDGGLWICSENNGLYYFDRTNEKLTVRKPVPEYPDSSANRIDDIFRDSRGLYWIFTDAGLFHFDREAGTFTKTEIPYSPLWDNGVNIEDFNLLELDDGSVWIPASPNGLYRHMPETGRFQNYRHDPDDPSSISSDRVTDIIEDGEGDLWITTFGGGLNLLKAPGYSGFEHIKYDKKNKKTIFSDSLNTLKMDRSGNIWIAGPGGFSITRPGNREFRSYRINYRHFPYSAYARFKNDIAQITEDTDGDMWFLMAGLQGFYHFNPGLQQLYQFADIQSDKKGLAGGNRLYQFFCGQAGTVWALTEDALNLMEKRPLKPFNFFSHEAGDPGSLSHSNIMSVFKDSEGVLWVGTFGPVLNRCSAFSHHLPVKFDRFQIYDKLYSPNMVISMAEDDRNSLWIGTFNGLYKFDKKSERFSPFRPTPLIDSLFNSLLVDCLYKDERGLLWIGTRGHGLFIYDAASGRLARYGSASNFSDSLPMYWNMTFCEDHAGNMWIGNFTYGLSRLAKEEIPKIFTKEHPRFKRYRRVEGNPASLSSDQVLQVVEDRNNRIWIGTTDGLNLYDPAGDIFNSFDESDGLPDDCIFGILEDDHGNLWISTLKGICKITLEDGYGKGIIKSVHGYGIKEGIEKPVFNEKCCFRSPDGWMYFGGINGLTVFHPDSIKESTLIPPVYITKILVNDRDIRDRKKHLLNESIYETKSIVLPFRQNFLAFEYVALNYLNAEKSQYRYRMEGLDGDWVEAGTRRYAEYRDLRSGQYTFRVIASNEDGLWNEEGASLMITIKPPWYRTILAYFVYCLALIAAVYGYTRWRTWRIRRERDQLEMQVRERTEVIENQNRDILETNAKLEEQKEELEQQTEELTQQKEELQITLDRLKETQDQLIQSEKMAALGGLVAGVAHEINTPVGICVTAASNLAEETGMMADKFKSNKISRAEFKEYLNTANQSAKLILANMERTAAMVQSFKQISADQSTDEKRRVVLRTYLEDIIRSLYPKLKGRRISINLDVDPNLEMDTYPGVVSQIFTNLILNSLVHGFEDKDKGEISIRSNLSEGILEINYSDNGKGIAKENMARIFDPFFTTNKKVGTGLGLHIVYNLVTQKLNGSITCESKPGSGAEFMISLPVN
jgi:ligand-binding sensor domain-containing protein/signal transduction histidine kinase